MRNHYIDWLRGFSIFVVLLTHGVLSPDILFFLGHKIRPNFAENGYYGVDLFFVISGFLITSRSIARWGKLGNIVPSEFYAMRVARILPLLVLFLLLCCSLFYFQSPNYPAFQLRNNWLFYKSILEALSFKYNWFYLTEGNIPGLRHMAPLWSLSVEEVFYLVFPLVCLVLRKHSLIIIGLIILIMRGPVDRPTQMFTLAGCQDMLAMGALAALSVQWLRRFSVSVHAALVCAGIGGVTIFVAMSFMPVSSWFRCGPSIVGIGGVMFLIGANYLPPLLCNSAVYFAMAPIALLGSLSYEIYLFHSTYREFLPYTIYPFGSRLSSIISLSLLVLFSYVINRFFTEVYNKKIRAYYLSPPKPDSRIKEGDKASEKVSLEIIRDRTDPTIFR